MPTFKEQLEQVTHLKHELAVWEMLFSHLDTNYLPRDGTSVQKAVKVSDCMVEIVSTETVEDVLKKISEGPIATLQGEINAIESQDIVLKGKAEA